jgi:hypothetical protein
MKVVNITSTHCSECELPAALYPDGKCGHCRVSPPRRKAAATQQDSGEALSRRMALVGVVLIVIAVIGYAALLK